MSQFTCLKRKSMRLFAVSLHRSCHSYVNWSTGRIISNRSQFLLFFMFINSSHIYLFTHTNLDRLLFYVRDGLCRVLRHIFQCVKCLCNSLLSVSLYVRWILAATVTCMVLDRYQCCHFELSVRCKQCVHFQAPFL